MKNLITAFFISLFMISCSKDEPLKEEGVKILPVEEETEVPEKFAGSVVLYQAAKVDDSYVLVNDAVNNRVYLMEKEKSEILYEWDLPSGIGNDAELLQNGNLLVALTATNPEYTFGGYGGRIAIISPEGDLLWDYQYSDEVNLAHHDIEMLSNGNVLILAWEKKSMYDLEINGYVGEDEVIYAEKLLEINPANNEIVWEWNSWDHLIQDQNSDALNFGIIKDHPQRINLNYKDHLSEGSYLGDIFHANGFEYDEERDLIYLSVNYFSEIWVIDHSTTTIEARKDTGGNFNKGGDLIYRFGNPAAYNNPEGERTFFHNHFPNLVPGKNNLLVYSNGIPSNDAHSIVYELKLPEDYNLEPNMDNELEVVWSFNHPDLFSAKVSGAKRLPNANTLITEGTSGFWEVTNSGEVVWKFEGEGFFWRGYNYEKDSDAIMNLGL